MESNSVPQQSLNLNRPEVLCLPAITGLAKIFTKNISAIVLTGTTYDVHLSSGTIFSVELDLLNNLPSDLKDLEDELPSFYDNMDGKTDNFHDFEQVKEMVDTGELEIVGVNKHDDDCSDGCVCGLDPTYNQYDDDDFDVHDDVTERYIIGEDEEIDAMILPAESGFFKEDTEDVVEDSTFVCSRSGKTAHFDRGFLVPSVGMVHEDYMTKEDLEEWDRHNAIQNPDSYSKEQLKEWGLLNPIEDTAEEVVESEPSQSDDDFMSPEVLAHLMGGGSIELQDGKFVIRGEEE